MNSLRCLVDFEVEVGNTFAPNTPHKLKIVVVIFYIVEFSYLF